MITDNILYHVWDAHNFSVDLGHHEEYSPYLPHVFELLKTTTDGDELYDDLVFIEETKSGGFKDDTLIGRRAGRVVDLLLEYRDRVFKDCETLLT
ncbi:MAG: hypothetical protein WBB19_14640 [Desulforhopalus sp.]